MALFPLLQVWSEALTPSQKFTDDPVSQIFDALFPSPAPVLALFPVAFVSASQYASAADACCVMAATARNAGAAKAATRTILRNEPRFALPSESLTIALPPDEGH